MVGQPSEHLIVDCVGPLPSSKSDNVWSSRHPATDPLGTCRTRAVVKVLTRFISVFGIPKVLQGDQGSNFSWDKQLGINVAKRLSSVLSG